MAEQITVNRKHPNGYIPAQTSKTAAAGRCVVDRCVLFAAAPRYGSTA